MSDTKIKQGRRMPWPLIASIVFIVISVLAMQGLGRSLKRTFESVPMETRLTVTASESRSIEQGGVRPANVNFEPGDEESDSSATGATTDGDQANDHQTVEVFEVRSILSMFSDASPQMRLSV